MWLDVKEKSFMFQSNSIKSKKNGMSLLNKWQLYLVGANAGWWNPPLGLTTYAQEAGGRGGQAGLCTISTGISVIPISRLGGSAHGYACFNYFPVGLLQCPMYGFMLNTMQKVWLVQNAVAWVITGKQSTLIWHYCSTSGTALALSRLLSKMQSNGVSLRKSYM